MITLLSNGWLNVFSFFFYHKTTVLITLGVTILCTADAQQELVFKNSQLQSGTAGADGAVYRFPNVTTNVDALVKINARSSILVKLDNLDLSNMGHDKAFQPQVTYNNGSIQGAANWWMEFQVSLPMAALPGPFKRVAPVLI